MDGQIVFVVTQTYTYDDSKTVVGVFDNQIQRDNFINRQEEKQKDEMFPHTYDWDQLVVNYPEIK